MPDLSETALADEATAKLLGDFDRKTEFVSDALWLPNRGPQADAFGSDADLLLYGGAAGGGKSDLLLGLALTRHRRSVIFRRAFVDLAAVEERLVEILGSREGYRADRKSWRGAEGRLIELGALEKPGAEQSWQGRPHDFIGFDEGAQLTEAKVAFVLGWLRSTDPDQRRRAVIASNPPIGGEGAWLIDWFAPWLDPLFARPARVGELRWAITRGRETVWVDGPAPVVVDGETYTPLSRSFIAARLEDNPHLAATGYRARLQNLPEPLRSQLLNGDFLAGREDDALQVIPSEWVRRAQARWRPDGGEGQPMAALACDPAMGGGDYTAIARLHANGWFAPMVAVKGEACREPADIVALMLSRQRDGCDLSVDGTGGWGSGVRVLLEGRHGLDCAAIVFSRESRATADGVSQGFANLRAELWWRFREALDPDGKHAVALPPDARLAAELTAPRAVDMSSRRILIESKDEIRKRIGGSTDLADAVVMAWSRREASARRVFELKRPPARIGMGWMGR
jgi:hypothetical protein